MARGKRAREEVDSYESDGGFVEEDDAPKSKKMKKAQSSSKSAASSKSKGDGENKFWEVSHFKSNTSNSTLMSSLAILWPPAPTCRDLGI